MKDAPEILVLACQVPTPIARAFFLGVKDRTHPHVKDDWAESSLLRFVGGRSRIDLTTLDDFVGADHIQEVLGR